MTIHGTSKLHKSKLVMPFVKWVGGKRQLLSEITAELPKDFSKLKYCEPFVGGGALFFYLQPKTAIINDANTDLMNAYNVIKENLEELIENLKKHKNEEEYFYKFRALYREELFFNLSKVEKASRFIYLNKTCFNGLFWVNNASEFITPFKVNPYPNIVNEPVLKAISIYLNNSNIEITSLDYLESLKNTTEKSFVYFDPPYHPQPFSSNYTGCTAGGWEKKDQEKLKEFCDSLHQRGIKFLLSNSSCDFIHSLYKDYKIRRVNAVRAMTADGAKRGYVEEVLIKNYD